jgi:hypothetical protein
LGLGLFEVGAEPLGQEGQHFHTHTNLGRRIQQIISIGRASNKWVG